MMSEWVAAVLLLGLPLCAVAGGLCIAHLTGQRRFWWVLVGLAAGTLALTVLALAIPGFANDLASAIVALVPEGLQSWRLAEWLRSVGLDGPLDGLGEALAWWRGLFELEAWRSMGFVLVPLAVVIIPVFLWQITKLHIND